MDDDLFDTLLETQKLEYAIYDASLRLARFSPRLPLFLSPDREVNTGVFITDTFIELSGYEETLNEISKGLKPPLHLEWISQTPLSEPSMPDEPGGSAHPAAYFHLQVYPFRSGLLVVVRDTSQESFIEQTVYNRRNELDLLSRKLINDLEEANAELNQAYRTTLEGWARALEMRDVETKGHSDRVSYWTRALCTAMGFDEIDIIFYCYGALLHDIGKMGIPDRILLKPKSLDETEWPIMKQHTLIAENLLSPIKFLDKALCIPAFHHERWDGLGYPYGLKGEEIPLPARIFSVVDVYDALTSDRPYRDAWTQADALKYIQERSGIEFDPRVVEVFLTLFQ